MTVLTSIEQQAWRLCRQACCIPPTPPRHCEEVRRGNLFQLPLPARHCEDAGRSNLPLVTPALVREYRSNPSLSTPPPHCEEVGRSSLPLLALGHDRKRLPVRLLTENNLYLFAPVYVKKVTLPSGGIELPPALARG